MRRVGVLAVGVAVATAVVGSAASFTSSASFQVRLSDGVSRPARDPEGVAALAPGGAYTLVVDRGTLSIASSNGVMRRVVARVPGTIVFATWSPDARSIAFESAQSGRFQVWVVHRDGSGEHLVRDDAAQPAWSPDSQRLAFVDAFRGTSGAIGVANVDGTNANDLTTRGAVSAPSWSPNGRWIAYRRAGGHVMVVEAGGGSEPRDVGTGQLTLWAPDSDRLAIVHTASRRQTLFIRPLSATRPVAVATEPRIAALAWSHNGRDLAYGVGAAGNASVHVADRNAAGRVTLLPPPGWMNGAVLRIAWSRDDSTLYYAMRLKP